MTRKKETTLILANIQTRS